MSTILGINLSSPSTQTQDAASSSFSLLSLVPPRYAFLFMLLTGAGCTLFTVYPHSRPDGDMDQAGDSDADIDTDGDVDSDSDIDADVDPDPDVRPDAEPDTAATCRIWDRLESYSGPPGTENIGICQPRIEECFDGIRYIEIQPEVLPRDEVVGNGVDENCDGYDDECNLGESEYTYSGLPASRHIGACQDRIAECRREGSRRLFIEIQPEVLPTEEIPVNRIDEDCDGILDECHAGIDTTHIRRDGDTVGSSVTLGWSFIGRGDWAVDIYTISEFSTNAASWRIAEVPERLEAILPPDNTYIFHDASSQVGSGRNVFYKVVCAGTSLTTDDLMRDVVGKFDLAVGPPENFFISIPLAMADSSVEAVIGGQAQELDSLTIFNNSLDVVRGTAYQSGRWAEYSSSPIIDNLEMGQGYGYSSVSSALRYITIVGWVRQMDGSRTIHTGAESQPIIDWIGNYFPVPVAIAAAGLNGMSCGDSGEGASVALLSSAGMILVDDAYAYHRTRDGWEDSFGMPSSLQLLPGRGYMIQDMDQAIYDWVQPRPW